MGIGTGIFTGGYLNGFFRAERIGNFLLVRLRNGGHIPLERLLRGGNDFYIVTIQNSRLMLEVFIFN